MENAFFSSTMTPGCHVSGTERTKTISTSGDKAHGLRAVICRSVDLEGWMQKVFKGGPCHYLNKVSSHSEEKGPVLRRWLILVKGFTLQGSVARWSARERGMEKAGAEAMFLTHFPHITHGRSFLLSAIISPVLKEAHLFKTAFLQAGPGFKLPIPGSHLRSIQSEELGRGPWNLHVAKFHPVFLSYTRNWEPLWGWGYVKKYILSSVYSKCWFMAFKQILLDGNSK